MAVRGLPRVHPGTPDIGAKQLERIKQRVVDGMSAKEIASSMGVSVHTVRRVIGELGGVRAIRAVVNAHLGDKE